MRKGTGVVAHRLLFVGIRLVAAEALLRVAAPFARERAATLWNNMRNTARLAVFVLALVTACGGRPGRVVILGIDGLHLPLLDQLVVKGELPNFARLYREGAVGGVSTTAAGLPSSSPLIWTSFATGQLPSRHGVTHWVRNDENGRRRLYSSRDRLVPALWEIVSEAGKSVGVVNWVATYPAERVDGFVVSDRYLALQSEATAKHLGVALERDAERLVYPTHLATVLDGLHLSLPKTIALSPDLGEEIDRAVFQVAYAALARHSVDLLMIYTRSMDEVSHWLWSTHEPLPGEPSGPDQVGEFMRMM